jgi:gamma-glutamyltranspeptidase/glutathione hydrolase
MHVQVAHGKRGMAATGHAHGTEAALQILNAGGNAVDAAIAAALVLAVVAPYATSLGGELYALVYDPQTQTTFGLNASGRSPAATRPGAPPRTGARSATVPALLRGLDDLLQRHGTLPFARLAAPAIAHAAEGFVVHPTLAKNTRERAELLARNVAAGALFLPGGEPLREGTLFVQADLAEVLERVAAGGVDAFYAGELTDRFVRACSAAGGTISAADLAGHHSLWQTPMSVPFYGHDVWTMPPNSYGPTLLLQLLDLQRMQIGTIDPGDPAFIDAGIEARRRAYAAAVPWIADPRLTEAAATAFIADAAGRGTYDAPRIAGAEPRDRCTTNAIVVDETGLAVSLVESISAPYGAGVVVAGTGILLNNRMAGFDRDPAHANGLAGGKRPANTLAPCVVTRDGALTMSLGTPGTVGQTCTLAQFLARHLACGETAAEAAAAPRWSVDFGGRPIVEDTMEEGLRAAVLARHPEARVMPSGWISFGSIKLAAVSGAGYEGVADYRRAATTAGW